MVLTTGCTAATNYTADILLDLQGQVSIRLAGVAGEAQPSCMPFNTGRVPYKGKRPSLPIFDMTMISPSMLFT